ncbi:myb-related transcription factor, partner of profilin-like [Sinocyclocheilus anshuiensis]|uniref:Myb-related transcription factor, partner of profilin-like n=1 Tax=Sinocyclocheilus anshuiensis TaxID=1608454 RepID=A0A671NLI8_9TELE|nr:PREDICTED: myb-related transcription factor, partner of profilin-like [Sinocyclocheilus anshuiensis]XP_016317628.1 PREDICTED: myb-related transcription factor, partner of profilin-like [Sinocyclocheilus anshuiensis]XP_016317629.1 PREDICTED: myb-related transcription factor, partner of profilin-like [Sinocyclocheilus anshuiensis]
MSEFMPYPYRGPGGALMRFKKRKSRFTFQEVELLLSEVQKKRHILVGKFNRGISKDLKNRTWADVTARINEVSECHREIIEVIKKWADLKCDTKRRVAAMRASGATAAQIAQELSPIETMVHQILQMSNPNKNVSSLANDDQMDDEDEDIPGLSEMPHSFSHMANGRPHSFGLPMPPPFHTSIPGKSDTELPAHVMFGDSSVPLIDVQTDTSEKEGSNMQFIEPRSQPNQNPIGIPGFLSHPIVEKSHVREKPNHNTTFNGPSSASIPTFIAPSAVAASSSRSAPARLPPQPAPVEPRSLKERLSQSASLSLQEQQATTLLIGSLSRSLESLAESVQRLVHTQQQFSRDTLQLQRDTLHVLRDFSSNALTLLQDKVNGHP